LNSTKILKCCLGNTLKLKLSVIQITELVIKSVSPFHCSPNNSSSSHQFGAVPQE